MVRSDGWKQPNILHTFKLKPKNKLKDYIKQEIFDDQINENEIHKLAR